TSQRPMRPHPSTRVLLSVLAAGCAAEQASVGPGGRGVRLPEGATVVDLTYPFDDKTLYWPTETPGFVLEPVHVGKTEAGFFYSAYKFCAPEHGGTHLDAPVHFAEGKSRADAVPLARLVGPALVIDRCAAAA